MAAAVAMNPQDTAAPAVEEPVNSRTSFTADSPYYTSYVENEMRQLDILTDTLKDISARAKTFGKCGALMAEATRRLALACRLKPSQPIMPNNVASTSDDEGDNLEPEERVVKERQEAVGDEMMVVLGTLGEILDEVADAQVQMCESLEVSLSDSLEAFCGTQVTQVTQLKSEAESMTDAAEQSFSKYLNGRNALSTGSDTPIDSWNKLSDQVSVNIGSTFSKWRAGFEQGSDKAKANNNTWNRKDASRVRTVAKDADPSLIMATTAANLRLSLEQIRLAQAAAELKRFQLLKKLVSIKKRRNFELGESALASLHGIRAYFHHCSDLVQGLSPRMSRIQVTQTESRDKHLAAQEPWEARESGLVGALDNVGQSVAHATSLADMIASGELATSPSSVQVPIALQTLEDETQIWELTSMLANASRYQREPAPGVFVEGWIYKKSSNRISLQQWNKRWFMMDKDGIYYFRSSAEMKKHNSADGYLHTLERVKICDLVLCTVRELGSTDGLRFMFEIITPNQRPLQLQARGPLEYKMWVDGIRTSIETQLVSGTVDAGQLMQGIGKMKKKKTRANEGGGGVMESVATLASMLESETVPNRNESTGEAIPMTTFRGESSDDDDEEDYCAEDDFLASAPRNPLANDILESNPVCADCSNPSPDWVSLNLGILVCIECSGVHRSLGVHVSKVRSLKLDSLSDSEGRLLLALGNDQMNTIYEEGIKLQQGWTKPTGDAGRQIKENWIKSKYQWKGFLKDHHKDKNTEEKQLVYSKSLYEHAKAANLFECAKDLAYGGSAEWKNPDEDNKTALHVCAQARIPESENSWLGIECAELLLQNGAKIDTMDDNTQSVLDCAVIGNGERAMVEFLSARAQ